jgi:hypothetical protein
VELAKENKANNVTAKHIDEVRNAMQKSPTAAYLRQCSLQERIMLAALYKCVRNAGVPAIPWSSVGSHVYPYFITTFMKRAACEATWNLRFPPHSFRSRTFQTNCDTTAANPKFTQRIKSCACRGWTCCTAKERR